MTRAAVYARISSDRDGTALGVERQVRDCEQLAAERGWTIVATFVDNDVSASDRSRKRPEYERLVASIKNGGVDAVVVWDLDRLHRQPAELEEFVTICEGAGVTQLASVGGQVDVATGDGMLVARIKGAVAAEEVRKMKQRMTRKKLDLAEKGLPNGGGRRAFGWERDGCTVRNVEANLIQQAAERVLQGQTLRSIRDDWEGSGVPTSGGGKWTVNSVKATLRSPRNAGLRQYQGQVVGEADWPAIINRSTWEELQVTFSDPSRQPRSAPRAYPLRGVLRCGSCGHLLIAVPRKKPIPSDPDRRLRYYGCRSDAGGCGKVFVTADRVESAVFDCVLALLDDPSTAAITATQAAADADTIRTLLVASAKDQAQLAELEDAFAQGDLSRAGLQRNARTIRDRIEQRNDRVASLQGIATIDRFGGDPREVWDDLGADDKRSVVLSLVTAIEVAPATKVGFNRFDPDRIRYVWRLEALYDIVKRRRFINLPNTDTNTLLTDKFLQEDGDGRPPAWIFVDAPTGRMWRHVPTDASTTPEEVPEKAR